MSNACILVCTGDKSTIGEMLDAIDELRVGDIYVFVITGNPENVGIAQEASCKVEKIFFQQTHDIKHMSFAKGFKEFFEKIMIVEDGANFPSDIFEYFDEIEDIAQCQVNAKILILGGGNKLLNFQELKDDIFCRCADERTADFDECDESK